MIIYTRKLLLIDCAGAILSAFILGIVLVKYQAVVGIPVAVLQNLAITALVLGGYSLFSFLFSTGKWRQYLRFVAILNIFYCLLTIGLGYYYRDLVTGMGWLYIFIEVIVILSLSLLELKVSKRKD